MPNSGAATAYVWDALGRVATQTTGDKVQMFGWSADDHLLSVAQTTASTTDWSVAYGYDHRGERVSRTDGADATRYLSDNQNPTGYTQALAEVSADATATKANYWYADGFGPLAEAHNPGSPDFSVAFLLGDHLSTTRGLTAATTGAFSGIDYAPFGSITGDGGSLTTQHAFTGQWKDPRSGLQHHRARWLDSSLGRWASIDPITDWQSNFGHSYAYLLRLSTVSTDITGRDGTMAELTTGAAIALVVASIAVGFYSGYREYARTKSWAAAISAGLMNFGVSLLLGTLMFTPIGEAVMWVALMALIGMTIYYFWNNGVSKQSIKEYIEAIIIPILIFAIFHSGTTFIGKALMPEVWGGKPSFGAPVKDVSAERTAPLYQRAGLKMPPEGEVVKGIHPEHPIYEKVVTEKTVIPWGGEKDGVTSEMALLHKMGYTEDTGCTSWTTDINVARSAAKGEFASPEVQARIKMSERPGIIIRARTNPDHAAMFSDKDPEFEVLMEGEITNVEIIEYVNPNE